MVLCVNSVTWYLKIFYYLFTNSLFHSHMSYASQVWAQSENSKTRRTLILQKKSFTYLDFLRLFFFK